MFFLRQQFWRYVFWKCIFWGSSYENVGFWKINCFERVYLKMYFWRYQVWPNWLFLEKGRELKNWMLEQPVKNKSCSCIQFLLWDPKWVLLKVLSSFLGARNFHFRKWKIFFSVLINFFFFFFFWSLGLKVA